MGKNYNYWVDELKFKLSLYLGHYPFIPEDEIEVTTHNGNSYPVMDVFTTAKGISMSILLDWGDDKVIDAEEFTDASLEKIYDAIEPPLTLVVSNEDGEHIFCKDFDERCFGSDDVADVLNGIFNLKWEFVGDEKEWKWEYRYNGETKLFAEII